MHLSLFMIGRCSELHVVCHYPAPFGRGLKLRITNHKIVYIRSIREFCCEKLDKVVVKSNDRTLTNRQGRERVGMWGKQKRGENGSLCNTHIDVQIRRVPTIKAHSLAPIGEVGKQPSD